HCLRLARPPGDGPEPAAGAGRCRGPALPTAPWLRPRGDPGRARQQRQGAQGARRQHHHPAGGQEPVPVERAKLGAQGHRGLVRAADRVALAQAQDPGGVCQRRRIRRRRVRGTGGSAHLVRTRRGRPDPGTVGAAGRGVAQPAPLQRRQPGALRAAQDPRHRAPDAAARRRLPRYNRAMNAPATDRLTVVVAAFDEAESLPPLHERVATVLDGLRTDGVDGRMLYVDDGSRDGTWNVLQALAARDPRVALLRLSRNFGKEAALTAGLDQVTEGAALILDADGQDPPELIPRFVERWREGYDDVHGT